MMALSHWAISQALVALLRGLAGVFHPLMLLLTVLPFAVAGALWGALGWLYWDAWTDVLREFLTQNTLGATVRWLVTLTGIDLNLVLAPLLGMLILVPLVVATALLLIAVVGMPLIVRHVAKRRFETLAARQGGTWWGSTANSAGIALLLLVGWLITLPFWLLPVIGPAVPLLLLGWATAKTFGYDALAEHADADELVLLRHQHRWPLLLLGVLLALFSSVPTLLWLSGALAIPLLPVLALVSVWLYGAVFVGSGLAFTHYCLGALSRHRQLQLQEQPRAPELDQPDLDQQPA
jgi:Etoposide-induced protein 2.4 (EI24)